MKKNFFYLPLVALVLLLSLSEGLAKETAAANLGSYAQQLPDFNLKDPAGKTWSKNSVAKDGVVLVVTAPILSNKGAQEGWDKHLRAAKSGSKAMIVFIEDMKPSAFKGKALKGMKKDYEPGKEPILLIDDDGSVRQQTKVPQKKTVVLVYDGGGKLVYASGGKPSSSAAAAAFEKVK